jgi:L-asparaginase II
VAGVRGDTVEMVHVGSVAVVDAAGRLIAAVGDPEALHFTRSALKPFQALPFVRDGGLQRYGFGSQELALMCASHNGEAVHLSVVRRILSAIGAHEADLQCGCHAPYYYAATDRRAPDQSWGALSHNCSGKHAGFLAASRLHGEPLDDYLALGAPVQARVRAAVAEVADGGPIALGIDGCSAPNLALPLTRLARLYARLAVDDTLPLAALRFAMTRHPDLVSGTGRGDLALMRTGGGDWVSKVGADGVQAIGVRSRGLGIAIRIADGNKRALEVATAAVLQQLGLLPDPAATALADWVAPPIRNWRGTPVGRVQPVFALPSTA